MSEFSPSLPGSTHRSQVCCASSQDSILPVVANMGSALLRGICTGLSEVNHAICPASSSSTSVRKRVEDLILEVDDARQENQRLNRNVQKMRHVMKAGPEGYSDPRMQGELMNEDAQQLKRLLRDLQHENNQLRIHEQGSGARLQNAGRNVSFTEYQNLQQQVQEMQRALKQAGNQAGMLPSGGSHILYSSQMPPPPKYGHGSRHTSGRQSPMSGTSTPAGSYGTSSSQFYGQGSSVSDADEIKRQVMAAQQENDMLRNKVRMLASN